MVDKSVVQADKASIKGKHILLWQSLHNMINHHIPKVYILSVVDN